LTRRRDGLLSYVGRLNAFDAKISGILTEYDVKEVIARGLYSTFQVCVHRESGKQLILKTTPLPESFDETQFSEEFKSLSALSQHPNLIKLLAFHLPPKSGRVQFLLEQTTCGNVIEFAAARAMCSVCLSLPIQFEFELNP
jgi:serine/threonine protein kinase